MRTFYFSFLFFSLLLSTENCFDKSYQSVQRKSFKEKVNKSLGQKLKDMVARDKIQMLLILALFIIIKIQNTMENMSIQKNMQNPQIQVAGFISKTFQILNVLIPQLQNEEYTKIIQWETSGKEFIIKDIDKFQDIVLPRYFRHRKMNSFVRQLNMYGFHKSRKDNSKCIFSHPSFVKDGEDLLIKIQRKVKDSEINFDTPVKPVILSNEKFVEDTCCKETEKNKPFEDIPLLASFMQNNEKFNSLINLNISLRKLSANNLDLLEDNQDDENVSIIDEMQVEEQKKTEKINIMNPSFFFCSFNSVNLN